MSNKHTPGPWRADGTHIQTPVGGRIAYMANRDEQALADARLIAAAPELLEALKELTAWDLENLPGEVSLGFSGIEKDIALAKAAIAKAIGS